MVGLRDGYARGRTGGGRDEQVHTACAQFSAPPSAMLHYEASPPGEPAQSGPLWTRTALCVCRKFDVFFFLFICTSLLHIVVLSRVA